MRFGSLAPVCWCGRAATQSMSLNTASPFIQRAAAVGSVSTSNSAWPIAGPAAAEADAHIGFGAALAERLRFQQQVKALRYLGARCRTLPDIESIGLATRRRAHRIDRAQVLLKQRAGHAMRLRRGSPRAGRVLAQAPDQGCDCRRRTFLQCGGDAEHLGVERFDARAAAMAASGLAIDLQARRRCGPQPDPRHVQRLAMQRKRNGPLRSAVSALRAAWRTFSVACENSVSSSGLNIAPGIGAHYRPTRGSVWKKGRRLTMNAFFRTA